ncbi:unnamed protein product [Cylicocyclus nassatus]|uniref:Uncharacterized protein n=1 Tax=Cylicocyclus nassatus TaxID=53992 RepID=A0AA36DI43_CYLNA|nr:unnamed protein product [Cylicocyclus nassatus]
MALLPVHSFPSAVFFEARMLGQPATVVSQVGLSIDAPECSVAVFSRASGVLLVAGVGSYCVYRICTKYLGTRFVWMLLDSARLDNIATADRRLLYASDLYSDEESDESEVSSNEHCRNAASCSASEVSVLRLARFPRKSRGLFAIRQTRSGNEGVLRRPSTSGLSSRSRAFSSSMSDRSASLRIVWEGQQDCWEDEFANEEPQPGPSIITRSPLSPTMVRESPSIGDLGSVFDDVLSLSSAISAVGPDLVHEDVVESDDPNHELMRLKCMGDSKYMYQSVIVASSELGSDVCSFEGSVMSTRSNLHELRKRLSKVMDPQGLWDLAQEMPGTSYLKAPGNDMTDSGFSRSSHSKLSHEHRSLFDSAISGELSSSEDESVSKAQRHALNPLQESDSVSLMSLEWCDEVLRDEDCNEERLRGDCEWGLEMSESGAGSSKLSPFVPSIMHRPKDSRDLMVYACEKFQPYSPQFKRIQQLYHRGHLRRIGPSPRTADETLQLFVSCALYHGQSILHNSSLAAERLASCVSECNLHGWLNTSVEQMCDDLGYLSETQIHPSSAVTEAQKRGLAYLLMLAANDVCIGKMNGDASCSWFTKESAMDVMTDIERGAPLDEISWRLLGSCCDVSIELVDMTTQQVETIRLGASPQYTTWLRVSQASAPQPLFYVPDD